MAFCSCTVEVLGSTLRRDTDCRG